MLGGPVTDATPTTEAPTPPEQKPARRRPRAAPRPDLDAPELYLNEELSRLEFNRRVLEQARDEGTPLLERLRFLTICSSNLDEFFEIRVAGLEQKIAFGVHRRGADGLSTDDVLARISTEAHRLVADQYRVLNDELLPALAKEGIRLLRRADWNERQRTWARAYFRRDVAPILTPVGLDPAHPFPRVLNKGLAFIVSVDGTDAFGRRSGIAVVQVPRSLPRLLRFPRKIASGPDDFVMLSSIIRANVGELFPGMAVEGCSEFRVTRNSDLWVDEEEVEDLLAAVKGELTNRKYGVAVRLEIGSDCSEAMAQFLVGEVELAARDVYHALGPVNLHRLAAIYELTQRSRLKYAPFTPATPKRLRDADIFDVIRKGDVLLHHPYESFAPVVDLVRQAARDPNVLAIKQTLYRTGSDSPVVEALVEAARAGKEVTALVELRARFDEAANIDLATKLQEVGANVAYGIVGYKAHAKALIVIRREGRRLRRYVHLGTGNYHVRTARAYTDFSFFSCDEDLGEDVQRLFQHLTGLGRTARMRKLVTSPFDLHPRLLQLIRAEADAARAGKPAKIVARMNSLSEPSVIRALYAASQAGVRIDLLVRGVCCLRPGVPGVSETIRVRSVVGRFLEHGRVFHFHAGGAGTTYLASADWMPRNLFRRVETCFPIDDAKLRARVLDEGLTAYFADNVQSWALSADGSWRRGRPGKATPHIAQSELLAKLAE
ncbi:MAG: polyphosphate kinase 1 [Planctomycetes bacterium]|nr:polyphosphate kinase 1 [Planctomycetota bacterium]